MKRLLDKEQAVQEVPEGEIRRPQLSVGREGLQAQRGGPAVKDEKLSSRLQNSARSQLASISEEGSCRLYTWLHGVGLEA